MFSALLVTDLKFAFATLNLSIELLNLLMSLSEQFSFSICDLLSVFESESVSMLPLRIFCC